MKDKIDKIIYETSLGARDNHRFFKDMEKSVYNEIIPVVEGNIHAYYYDIFRRLSDSINNAGHEERRSKDISLIHKEMNKIANNFEDFLP